MNKDANALLLLGVYKKKQILSNLQILLSVGNTYDFLWQIHLKQSLLDMKVRARKCKNVNVILEWSFKEK